MIPKPDNTVKPATDTHPQPDDQNQAQPPKPDDQNEAQPPKPDPTRYGDWEKNGRCIDF